jgi:exopolysaccharide biosynthesis polyprenyl glycosylphosphotransferase
MLLSFLSCAAGFSLSLLAVHSLSHDTLREAAAPAFSFGLIAAFLHHRERKQHPSCGVLRIRESERVLRVAAQSNVILFIFNVIWNLKIPNGAWILALIVIPAVFLAQTHAALTILDRWQLSTGRADRTILFGAKESARAIVSALNNSPRLGAQLVSVAEPNPQGTATRIAPFGYRGRTSIAIHSQTVTPDYLESLHAELLVLSAANLTEKELRAARRAAEEAGVKVGVVYDYSAQCGEQIVCDDIEGMVFVRPADPEKAWLYSAAKRITDAIFSLVLLVLLSPVLLLIAMLIRFDSPGPALFVQQRVGRGGSLFNMYKFRSMYASAPKYEVSPTSSQDRRITRIGNILRRTSLDELPQLINVLLGNMSLVGPRPEMPFIVDGYELDQRRRLAVTPGITGIWQLSADRAFPIHHNLEYDLYYIRNRNLFMDFAILIHTLFFAVSGGV